MKVLKQVFIAVVLSSVFGSLAFCQNSKKVPFISHSNYLAMNLEFSEYQKTFAVMKTEIPELKNRGEAHITVINPNEFKVLSRFLTMKEIENIASEIQSAQFSEICLGTSEAGNKKAFYVVVESEQLLQIRKNIAEVFYSRGGANSEFDAELFFPHITVGFIVDDVHYEQGARKDRRSCLK